MLGLTLRQDFAGRRLKGTAIELANTNGNGATHVSAKDLLAITYPTMDVLAAIEATGPERGQTVVLKGERGQGKSHLMAVLHHALSDEAATRSWLTHWSGLLGRPTLAGLSLLWSGAQSEVERIMSGETEPTEYDGPLWSGLYHPRIS